MRLVLLLTTVAVLATAQTTKWKMNSAKSDFGGDPMPQSLVWVIHETAEKMDIDETLVVEGQERSHSLTFLKGGKESVNRIGEVEMVTKITEDADGTVREQSTIKLPNGAAINRTSVTRVTDEGKILVQESETATPDGGKNKRRLVMEQQ